MHYETDELVKKGAKFRLSRVTIYPMGAFIRTYFMKLGFLEGYRGFLLAVLDSVYCFMMYAKLYEREKTTDEPNC